MSIDEQLTQRQAEARARRARKAVRVRRCYREWQVWLVVGVQSFTVGPSWDTAPEARWYAERLRSALDKLLI